jgi:antitoxin component of RelBE/YafQ-DinJ toxin-antitoxin module
LSEGSITVAVLRANSSIPFSVIPDVIVKSFNSVIDSVVSNVNNEALQALTQCGVSSDVVKIIKTTLKRHAETMRSPLEFLSTSNRQDKPFALHPLVV